MRPHPSREFSPVREHATRPSRRGLLWSRLFRTQVAAILAIGLTFGGSCLGETEITVPSRVLGISNITSLDYSPDGSHIVVACEEGFAKLYDAATGAEVRSFLGHSDEVTDVAFGPNGDTLVTSSLDHTARLWNTATGEMIREFDGSGSRNGLTCVAISPDGSKVAAGLDDSGSRRTEARVWEAATGQVLHNLTVDPDDGHIGALEFSPDSSRLLAGSYEITRLWDVTTGAVVRTYTGTEGDYQVTSLAFSPDGSKFVGSGLPGIWDVDSGALLHQVGDRRQSGKDVDFSPDGMEVLVVSVRGGIQFWNVSTGNNTGNAPVTVAEAVAYSPDGTRIAAGGGAFCQIWNRDTELEEFHFGGRTGGFPHVSFGYLLFDLVVFTNSGANPFTKRSYARIWDAKTGREIGSIGGYTPSGVNGMAMSPWQYYPRLFAKTGNSTVQVWDYGTGQFLGSLDPGVFIAHGFAVNSTASSLLAWGNSTEGAHMFSATTGELLHQFSHDGNWVVSGEFSPDGKLVATVGRSNNSLKLWRTDDGALTHELEMVPSGNSTGGQGRVMFSPRREELISANVYGRVQVYRRWDTTTGDMLHELMVPVDNNSDGFQLLAMAPNGHVFAVAQKWGEISLHDATTLEEFHRFHWKPKNDTQPSLAFSPNGYELAACEHVTRIYDVANLTSRTRIQGRVHYRQRGWGGVTITAKSEGLVVARTSSDAGGDYRLDGLPPGTYQVTASPSSFPHITTEVVLTAGLGVRRLNFPLRRRTTPTLTASRIYGIVTNSANDLKIGDAIIEGWIDGVKVGDTHSNIRGAYSLRISNDSLPATVSLKITAPGYLDRELEVLLPASKIQRNDIELTQEDAPSGGLTGRVIDVDTALPMADIVVVAKNLETGLSSGTETDANGVYSLPGLAVGSYSVQTSAPSYFPADEVTAISAGNTAGVSFQLQPDPNRQAGTLTSTVAENESGAPEIRLTWPAHWIDPILECSTDLQNWISLGGEVSGNSHTVPSSDNMEYIRVRYEP